MKKLFVLLISIVLLASCEQTITIDLGEYDPKIVVYGVLEPDSVVRIYITESQAYLRDLDEDDQYGFIQNATVVLSNGIQTDTLTIDSKWEYQEVQNFDLFFKDSVLTYFYTSNMNIERGKDYSLEVFSNGRKATATTHVPEPVEITDAFFEIEIQSFFGFSDTVELIKGTFADVASEGDYYRIEWVFDQWSFNEDSIGTIDSVLYTTTSYSNTFYDDIASNGDEKEFKEWFYPLFYYSPDMMQDTIEVKVRLDHISKSLAEYIDSYNEQNYAAGDPFSEPVFIKSNIEGGLGVFGSFTPSDAKTVYVLY